MPSLRKDLRDDLKDTIRDARVDAEKGAKEALTAIGVDQGKALEHLKPEEISLRKKLRARGRQAGDVLDDRGGRQTIDHLIQIVAYEQWHRMLFARFLAENGLLLEPENQVAVSLADVDELARDAKVDIWDLAGRFAERMLPSVFRADDPVLALPLARETRGKLEKMVASLPREVFLADDSLGWTYQFWQAQRKEEVNRSEVRKGAEELSPVTQLFTEDYMVDFLLHNTLGAWWAGKFSPIQAPSEEAARLQVELPAKNGLPAMTWTYLRFVKDEATQTWTPAAGTFPGWPKEAKKITFLDPSMGSGHFIVFALPILARLRMEEEHLAAADAVTAVLRDNILGLELDERCTQIAAFNLALTAWKLAGYQPLPALHLACSGLAPNASEAAWVALGGTDPAAQNGMAQLYRLFKNAPVLGSLINPRAIRDELLDATFYELQPLLEKALAQEVNDDSAHEMAVTAQGLVKAADILARKFVLVATNVPFLGRPEQVDPLKDYCEQYHYDARHDLATCFVERCIDLTREESTVALVTPQSWFNQPAYTKMREALLASKAFLMVGRLGPRAFETITGERVNVCLPIIANQVPEESFEMIAIRADKPKTPSEKARELRGNPLTILKQRDQLNRPDSVVVFEPVTDSSYLSEFAYTAQGFATSDNPPFIRMFWEFPSVARGWVFAMSAPERFVEFGGRSEVLLWEDGQGAYYRHAMSLKREGRLGGWKSGAEAWGRKGVLISEMGQMAATIYTGEMFDHTAHALIPKRDEYFDAIWAFSSSGEFRETIRKYSQKLNITNETLVKVSFDFPRWKSVAAEKYPQGLPKPSSNDPSQWLFNGQPRHSVQPLHVAVARLLGYQWPRQTGSEFPECPALASDGLESHADPDGIVCLPAVRGERSAVDRLRSLLSAALGKYEEQELITIGSKAKSLDDWLRDSFFEEHCALFHSRPFIWHIWDGRSDGFHAFINYHKLAAADGAGRKLLDLLVFGYLGDWIKKQRDENKKAGAEDRLVAAEALQLELKAILAGEPPYDLFVRWKPLHQLPIGWEPDINDGVRLNIRPFLMANDVGRKGAGILRAKPGSSLHWKKDRGTEPHRSKEAFPWFWSWDEQSENFPGGPDFDGNRWNDCHYTPAFKRVARERASSPKK